MAWNKTVWLKSSQGCIGLGVVDRRADEQAICFFKFLRGFVDEIVEDTFAMTPAIATANTAPDVFIADVQPFGLNSIFL